MTVPAFAVYITKALGRNKSLISIATSAILVLTSFFYIYTVGSYFKVGISVLHNFYNYIGFFQLYVVSKYIDHIIIKVFMEYIVLGKRSDCLISWFFILVRYAPFIEIIYRPGRIHRNTDTLSRLPVQNNKEIFPADIFNEYAFLINIVSIDPALRKVIITNLLRNKHLDTIYKNLIHLWESMKNNPDSLYTRKLHYHINISSKLIYFIEADGSERLYIFTKTHKLILITAHNHKDHLNIK